MKGYDKDNPESSLTGGQIQEVLDALIMSSMEQLIRSCSAFDLQMCHLLVTATRNRKRRISALDRPDFIDSMCNALMSDDKVIKTELVAESKIERGFLYKFIWNMLSRCDGYVDLYGQKLRTRSTKERALIEAKLRAIEEDIGADRGVLFNALPAAADFLELAYEFRNRIVSNYVNLAYKQARSFIKSRQGTFDFDDVHHNILTAVTRAIDKFDSSKGALTSYIGYWVLNALTTSNPDHGHEYGIAYTIPQVQRKNLATGDNAEINFSYSLSHQTGEDGSSEFSDQIADPSNPFDLIEKEEELDEIRRIVKAADIRGIGRLHLDVDEVFTAKERRLMRKTMRLQGTRV